VGVGFVRVRWRVPRAPQARVGASTGRGALAGGEPGPIDYGITTGAPPTRNPFTRHPESTPLPFPLRAILAVLILIPAAGCEDDPAGTPEAGPGTLTGTVARAKTGEGVANALVALVRDGTVRGTAATDGDGAFAFDGIPDGPYDVHLTGLELTGLSLLHTTFEPRTQRVEVSGETEPLLFAAVGVVPGRITGVVRCGGVVDTDAAIRIVGGAVDTTVGTNSIGRYALTDLGAGYYALFPVRARCLDGLDPRVVGVETGQYVGEDFDG
jgi:hypothetical protein